MTVDMDEISGQGKQMFMVTAMGTAIRARRVIPAPPRGGVADGENSRLRSDEVGAAERRRRLMSSLESGVVKFDDDTWSTLMEERVSGAVAYLVPAYVKELARTETRAPEFQQRAVAFLERLSPEEAAKELYPFLDTDEQTAAAAAMFIEAARLRDLGEIHQRLRGPAEHRRRALKMLAAGQQTFAPSDVQHLRAIAALCTEGHFPRIAKLITKKKGLFGGGDEIECVCGEKRSAEQTYCWAYACKRDVYGFRDDEMNPVKARAFCESLATTLEFAFTERTMP
jgi:hypothetical protein